MMSDNIKPVEGSNIDPIENHPVIHRSKEEIMAEEHEVYLRLAIASGYPLWMLYF